MTEETLDYWQTRHDEGRQRLREHYASFYESARKAAAHSIVIREGRRFRMIYGYLPSKERQLGRDLMTLQKNLEEQALLLLELQHAIDCEREKETKANA